VSGIGTGDRKQSTLWEIENRNQDAKTDHSTQKPVECMRRPIVNNSRPGQAVYEPFCGSGTTIIACQTEGRVCLAVELSPAYVDMAVARWQDFTGFALGVERVELLIESLLGRLAGIDRASQTRGSRSTPPFLITVPQEAAPSVACSRWASGRRRPTRSSGCR
jgi:DNA methylase